MVQYTKENTASCAKAPNVYSWSMVASHYQLTIALLCKSKNQTIHFISLVHVALTKYRDFRALTKRTSPLHISSFLICQPPKRTLPHELPIRRVGTTRGTSVYSSNTNETNICIHETWNGKSLLRASTTWWTHSRRSHCQRRLRC